MGELLTRSSVSPIYYVTFTSAVLAASFTLFEGFNITDNVKSMSLLCGFLTIFTGVYLLNFNGSDPDDVDMSQYELASVLGSATRSRLSLAVESPRSSRDTTRSAGARRPSHGQGVGSPGYMLQQRAREGK
jgi:magnesium transporter